MTLKTKYFRRSLPYSLFRSVITSNAPFNTWDPGVSPGCTLDVKTITFLFASKRYGRFVGSFLASGYIGT